MSVYFHCDIGIGWEVKPETFANFLVKENGDPYIRFPDGTEYDSIEHVLNTLNPEHFMVVGDPFINLDPEDENSNLVLGVNTLPADPIHLDNATIMAPNMDIPTREQIEKAAEEIKKVLFIDVDPDDAKIYQVYGWS